MKGISVLIITLVVVVAIVLVVAFVAVPMYNDYHINQAAAECRRDGTQIACAYFDAQTEIDRAQEALDAAKINFAKAKDAYNKAQNQGGQ